METNNYILTVDRSKRFQVVIEDVFDADKTDKKDKNVVSRNVLFYEEYYQATEILKTIVESSKENKDNNGCNHDSKKHDKCFGTGNVEDTNNIILFTGHRGSGKTSCVRSVGKSIEDIGINDKKFKCLPIIDPSYFDDNSNILKILLAQMFKLAKCIKEKDHEGNDFNALWKKFKKAYEALGKIEGNTSKLYSLEELNSLSEASNIRAAMQELVNEFRKILPCNPDYLVLMIDDLDMNVSSAAVMLEQIRKFLMLDHLIILMAANLTQLHNEMIEHYSSAYKNTLRKDNQTLDIDVEDLASRYLLKVFPASRRIHVENATRRLIDTKIQITHSNDKLLENKFNGQELQRAVLTMIWERTRLLFIPKEGLLHSIIPTNLRDLCQFINFLLDMDVVNSERQKEGEKGEKHLLFADTNAYNICKKNFTKFKNHIMNNWIPENLSYEEEQLFRNIPQDVSEINKHLINAINVVGNRHKEDLMTRKVDLEQIAKNAEGVNIDRDIYTMVSPNDPRFVKANKISDIFNQPSNYSYGDLLLMIDKYETYFESDEDRKFINTIKIYYSMLLFETLFFKSTSVKYEKNEFEKDRQQGRDIIPIQKLIGGTIYYPNYFEIITSKYFNQKGPSFDAKRAFYHKFKINKEEDKTKFPPFFSILYYGDIRPDRYDQNHIYDTTFEDDADIEGTQYATFDILSIMSNMLNPWQTIYRFDNKNDDFKQAFNIDYYQKTIIDWGKKWHIENTKFFPNSILPFYSVDMMLRYLRKHHSDLDISPKIKEKHNNFEEKKEISKITFNKYTRESKEEEKQVTKETIEGSFPNYNPNYKVIITKSANQENPTIKFEIKKSPKSDKYKKANINYFDKKMDSNIRILFDAYRCFYQISLEVCHKEICECREMTEKYKNHVIALINLYYDGTQREKKDTIKKIHSYQSIAEVYEYLHEVLWRDAIMELYVKKEIQEAIHSKDAVGAYYCKLKCITETAIQSISLNRNDVGMQEESINLSLKGEIGNRIIDTKASGIIKTVGLFGDYEESENTSKEITNVYEKIFNAAHKTFILQKSEGNESPSSNIE